MAEYFDISLITRKTLTSKAEMNLCLTQFDLVEGVNKTKLFDGRQIIVTSFEEEKSNFEELAIGISNLKFSIANLDENLRMITDFVAQCFIVNPHIQYALCSFELNGYFIGRIKNIEEFDNKFLKQFPIVFEKNDSDKNLPVFTLNLNSQDIFN